MEFGHPEQVVCADAERCLSDQQEVGEVEVAPPLDCDAETDAFGNGRVVIVTP